MVRDTFVAGFFPFLHYAVTISSRKYYDLLEVTVDASESDLKKAYRKK
jgi:hypothetical protein